VYPELLAAVDGHITLSPWQSLTIQPFINKFAARHNMAPVLMHGGMSATPAQLIGVLRQCRLRNDMAFITHLLTGRAISEIGFLAKVS
jgi:hypothetical protein